MKFKKESYIKLRNNLIIYGSGFLLMVLSIIYFEINGYPRVNTATETLNIKAHPIYMISIFFPFGMLLGEIILMDFEDNEKIFRMILFLETILIGFVSFLRYISVIPFSGHSIILFFFLCHEIIDNKMDYPIRIIIGTLVLIITVIFKLFIWNDPITFIFGGIIGISLWIPGFIYKSRTRVEEI
ncbi:MAG: hypothetical protein ACFFAO_20415 [Candidatus Hermodarchaeota archaeon]